MTRTESQIVVREHDGQLHDVRGGGGAGSARSRRRGVISASGEPPVTREMTRPSANTHTPLRFAPRLAYEVLGSHHERRVSRRATLIESLRFHLISKLTKIKRLYHPPHVAALALTHYLDGAAPAETKHDISTSQITSTSTSMSMSTSTNTSTSSGDDPHARGAHSPRRRSASLVRLRAARRTARRAARRDNCKNQ